MAEHAQASTTGRPDPAIGSVAAQLRRLRARAKLALLVYGLAVVVCGVGLAGIAFGFLDYFVRTPAWLRCILWLGGAACVVEGVRQLIIPAVRFAPTLTELALRVERTTEGRAAGLPGVLASGLDLADSGSDAGPTTRALAQRVVSEATQRFAAIRPMAMLRPTRTRQSLVLAVLTVVLAGVVVRAAGPSLAWIGALRVAAPWSGAEWPRRTAVADATDEKVHALGTALALRAALTRQPGKDPSRVEVAANFRLVHGGEAGPVQRVLLTAQGRRIGAVHDVEGGPVSGELFERLIEPGALSVSDGPQVASVEGAVPELEYWFQTEDDRTNPRRIKLVQPPSVVSGRVTVSPPAYAADSLARAFAVGPSDAGPGNDQRAIIAPVLAGSKVELTVRMNKPLPPPPEGAGRDAWLAGAFPGAAFSPDLAAEFDGAQWKLAWTIDQTTRVAVVPTDAYGLHAGDDAAYTFEVVADHSPTAVVTEPREDEQVLATAVIDLAAEGRDDVGVAALRLDRQMARPPAGSIGAAAEAAGEPVEVAHATDGLGGPSTTIVSRLDLGAIEPPLRPGEEVWVTALATDNYEWLGASHEPVRSAPRRLRVIAEEELIGQVRGELSGVRQAAMRIDEQQARLADAVRKGMVTADDTRQQAGVAQGTRQQGETLRRLAERVERNRVADPALAGLLDDVGELLRGAQEDAERAADELEAAAAGEDPAELTPAQSAQVGRAQESVRQQLGQLIEMLDKGEDGWLVRRELQRLMEQQRSLQADTRRMGDQTVGRDAGSLTPQERAALEQIAERQERLAEQADKVLDDLNERASQMREADAAQAAAMAQAAQRGRQGQVPEKMQDAAEQARQNQTGRAQEEQQQALEAMEQMLSDLDNAQRNRDETLRRVLASLIESLEALIQQQGAEIEGLAHGLDTGSLDGLDAGMIRLHQNTLGVLDQARQGFREMTELAGLIERAAVAQSAAIKALRADEPDGEQADAAENESLRLLKLAREAAQKLDEQAQQRDAGRKRQELRKVYREVLEQQVALRGDTDPFVGREVDRRDRMKLRGLGERQTTLHDRLEELREQTAELAEAGIFDFAHTRLDQATGSAAKRLQAGQADRAVARDQDTAIRVLKSLVDALNEDKSQDDEFRDGESGAGDGGQQGGSQNQPLIPPLAELRLLRDMQQEAADWTREANESPDAEAGEELTRAMGELQSQLAERGKELIDKMQQAPRN